MTPNREGRGLTLVDIDCCTILTSSMGATAAERVAHWPMNVALAPLAPLALLLCSRGDLSSSKEIRQGIASLRSLDERLIWLLSHHVKSFRPLLWSKRVIVVFFTVSAYVYDGCCWPCCGSWRELLKGGVWNLSAVALQELHTISLAPLYRQSGALAFSVSVILC